MHDLRITVADNGYVLKFDDPAIVERNRSNDDRWQDPERQRVYNTPEELVKDLGTLLPLLEKDEPKASNEYTDALAEAFAKGND